MMRSGRLRHRRSQSTKLHCRTRGFSLVELIVVVAIFLVLTAIAIPLVQNATAYFKLRGAVASVTGAIQSTRYQAIFQGCPYQIVLDSTANTYQVQNEPYSTATGACATAYSNVCLNGLTACPVPLSGSGVPATLNASTTLTFRPGGTVTSTTAVGGVTTMVIAFGGKTQTIRVSTYGNVTVTTP